MDSASAEFCAFGLCECRIGLDLDCASAKLDSFRLGEFGLASAELGEFGLCECPLSSLLTP